MLQDVPSNVAFRAPHRPKDKQETGVGRGWCRVPGRLDRHADPGLGELGASKGSFSPSGPEWPNLQSMHDELI